MQRTKITVDARSLQLKRILAPVIVAFRLMISHAAVPDAKPSECLQKARRSKLGSVGGRERHVGLAATLGLPFQHRLLDRCQGIFGPTAVRQIPTYDFSGATVDQTQRMRPTYR